MSGRNVCSTRLCPGWASPNRCKDSWSPRGSLSLSLGCSWSPSANTSYSIWASQMQPPVLSWEKHRLCLQPLLLRPQPSQALLCVPPVPQGLSNPPMSVATAARRSALGKTTPSTCSSTLGRSHISALCAGDPSRYATTCSNIWSHTPVCEPSSVQCVPSASLRRVHSMCTCAHIGLNVRPALPVAKFSHTVRCWSDTWQLTLHLDWEAASHS